MKKRAFIKLTLTALGTLPTLLRSQQIKQRNHTAKNRLIVYLTRTKNTQAVAEMIHTRIGGELLMIEPNTAYSENYQENVDEVKHQNDNAILPALKTHIDIARYDTIFVGFPTWGIQLPPPIKTFLNDNDWTGKTLIPFNTHAGFGLGSSQTQLTQYAPKAALTDVFSVKGGHERKDILYVMQGKKAVEVNQQVTSWLSSINL